jgi:hypothetical protein
MMGKIWVLLLACVLTGCGDLWPDQGAGALWLHERGGVRCVNVQSVHFVAARWIRYREAGEKHETSSPVDYRREESCPE